VPPPHNRALRSIAPGEEVTASYIDLGATLQERREELRATYHFDPAAAALLAPSPAPAAGAAPEAPGAAAAGPAEAGPPPPPLPPLYPPPLHVLGLPGGAALHVHGAGAAPPWPAEARDAELTRLVYLPSGASASARGGPAEAARPLPGGAAYRLETARDTAAAAARSFELEDEGGPPATASGDGGGGEGGEQRVWVLLWGALCPASVAPPGSSGPPADAPEGLSLRRTAEAVSGAASALIASQRASAAGDHELAAAAAAEGLRLADSHLAPADGQPPAAGLGERHLLRTRLLAAQQKAVIDGGDDWPLALAAARRVTAAFDALYPPASPNALLQTATLAKLECFAGSPAAAVAAAERAMRAAAISQPGGAIIKEMLQTRAEALEALREAGGGGGRLQ